MDRFAVTDSGYAAQSVWVADGQSLQPTQDGGSIRFDEPRAGVTEAPVTSLQAAYFFAYQSDPENTTHLVPIGFRIRLKYDLNALRRAVDTIVARHAILRTTYRQLESGETVQVVRDSIDTRMHVVDATDEEEVERIVKQERSTPFQLNGGSVFRVVVIRQGKCDCRVLMLIHNIACDFESVDILRGELEKNYRTEAACAEVEHESELLEFVDYVRVSLSDIREPHSTSAVSSKLRIPTVAARRSLTPFAAGQFGFELTKSVSAAVRAYASKNGCSPFTVLLACFKAVLQRYSRQDEIVVGIPCSERQLDVRWRGVVGGMTRAVPVSSNISSSTTFEELVNCVSQSARDAASIRFTSIEDTVRIREADPHYAPVFQAAFCPQESPLLEEVDGCVFEPMHFSTANSIHDLNCRVWDTGGTFAGLMEFNPALFDKQYLVRLTSVFESACRNLLNSPELAIRSVEMQSCADAEILRALNRTDVPRQDGASVIDLFRSRVPANAARTAATSFDGELSYQDLERSSDALAHHLISSGITRGDLVGVGMTRGVRLIVSLLGIWKAGAAFVPIDTTLPDNRIEYMLREASVAFLLTDTLVGSRFDAYSGKRVYVDSDWLEESRPEERGGLTPSSGEDLAYIIFTSGSSGWPKGVKVPHRALVNFLQSMESKVEITSSDVLLATTTLSFDISVLELLLPVCCGARVVVSSMEQGEDVRELLLQIADHEVTFLQATPSMWRLILTAEERFPGIDWSRVTVLCGGEEMPQTVARELSQKAARVWNMYGPTETTIWSLCKTVAHGDKGSVIGRPIENTRIRVVNDAGTQVPVGVPGELHISGDGVALGYLTESSLSATRFYPDPEFPGKLSYATGDLVTVGENQSVEFQGRIDDQVKLRGYRIELGEIEAVISEIKGIQQAVANVWGDDDLDRRLIAYVVMKEGRQLNSAVIRKSLRARLPGYMSPQHIVEVSSIPLNANGKIDRSALPSPIGISSNTILSPPETEVELHLANIWSAALGSAQIGREDNFFDLGGHSLLAIQVISSVHQEFGVRLSPRMIVMDRLSDIARYVEEARDTQ